jgi:hypothetical protein
LIQHQQYFLSYLADFVIISPHQDWLYLFLYEKVVYEHLHELLVKNQNLFQMHYYYFLLILLLFVNHKHHMKLNPFLLSFLLLFAAFDDYDFD